MREPPEVWKLAIALDRAAADRGWYIRHRLVTDDEIVIVYRRGLVPEPGAGRDDPA